MARFVAEATTRPICPGHGKVPRAMMTWLHRLRRGETSLTALTESDAVDED
jgi:hypothetical protein